MKGFNAVDKPTAAALHRMNSPEMQPLLKFLKNLADETDVALRRATGDTYARLQGQAQHLEQFLTAVEKSAETLEKMK